jgi:hypothetical protein
MTTIPKNGVSFVRNVSYCKIIKVFVIFNLIPMPVTPFRLKTTHTFRLKWGVRRSGPVIQARVFQAHFYWA